MRYSARCVAWALGNCALTAVIVWAVWGPDNIFFGTTISALISVAQSAAGRPA